MRAAFSIAALVLAQTLLVGCPEGVTLVPLYESEVDLCSEENAPLLEARIDACRERFDADGSCAGVVSFKGILLDEEVTVDADLQSTELSYAVFPDATVALNAIKLFGASPYFDFRIQADQLGGVADLGEVDRLLEVGGPTHKDAGWSTDLFAQSEMRVSAPPDSVDFTVTSGEINITLQTMDEHAGTFVLRRGDASSITGCFRAFTTLSSFSPEQVK